MIVKGKNTHRFKDNPEERRFAEAWAKSNEKGQTLCWLLDPRKCQTGYPPDVAPRDHEVAATVIQWLGSPGGQWFLHWLGYTRKGANKE